MELSEMFIGDEMRRDEVIDTTATRVDDNRSRTEQLTSRLTQKSPVDRQATPAEPAHVPPEVFALMDSIEAANDMGTLVEITDRARDLAASGTITGEQFTELKQQAGDREKLIAGQKTAE